MEIGGRAGCILRTWGAAVLRPYEGCPLFSWFHAVIRQGTNDDREHGKVFIRKQAVGLSLVGGRRFAAGAVTLGRPRGHKIFRRTVFRRRRPKTFQARARATDGSRLSILDHRVAGDWRVCRSLRLEAVASG